jgi:hypothetical protein
MAVVILFHWKIWTEEFLTFKIMYAAVLILLFHWFADFLLQSQTMAINKSKSNYWLSIHVAYYTFGISPIIALVALHTGLIAGIQWLILNAILHWITDFITSRHTSKLYAAQKFYGFPSFFSVIGLDQWIHAACLLLTYDYLTQI